MTNKAFGYWRQNMKNLSITSDGDTIKVTIEGHGTFVGVLEHVEQVLQEHTKWELAVLISKDDSNANYWMTLPKMVLAIQYSALYGAY
jgi:hypothetical protein